MNAKLNRIKSALAEGGRTGKWLANEMHVNITTVSNWCTNKTKPDLYTLKRIADLLNVNIKDLIRD